MATNEQWEQQDFWPEERLVHNYVKAINEHYGYDAVKKPKHYMLFEDKGIEVRDVVEVLLNKMASSKFEFSALDFSDYAQMMQYFMRFMDKNGKQDLEKGLFYLNELLESWKD